MASCGKTPPPPGLALLLESVCEPRRRDRLPEGGDERRSRACEDSRLALAATERPATAHRSLQRRGRSGPTRESGATPGRRNHQTEGLLSLEKGVGHVSKSA